MHRYCYNSRYGVSNCELVALANLATAGRDMVLGKGIGISLGPGVCRVIYVQVLAVEVLA